MAGRGGKMPGAGRKKGTPNKLTVEIKELILAALEEAGGNKGSHGYLVQQAKANPVAFLGLVGKIIPRQITGEGGGPVLFEQIKRVIVDSAKEKQ